MFVEELVVEFRRCYRATAVCPEVTGASMFLSEFAERFVIWLRLRPKQICYRYWKDVVGEIFCGSIWLVHLVLRRKRSR